MNLRRRTDLMALGLLLLGAVWGAMPARAQWLSQSFTVLPGWSAVYLHVDASHATLDELIGSDPGNPITEVWRWQPAATTGQSLQQPVSPTGGDTQWTSWTRALGPSAALQRLAANTAYLVRSTNTEPYAWTVKGRPVPLDYAWTSSGLNFIGFPAAAPVAPTYHGFLAPSPALYGGLQVIRYVGGELGAGNPVALADFLDTPLVRGEAFWIRSDVLHNRYFGPFELELQEAGGVRFGGTLGQYRVLLRNHAESEVTVSLEVLDSEVPPAGETAIVGAPPVLVRGALHPTNLVHAYTVLATAPSSWTLAPKGTMGSEVEIVLGVNRSQIVGAPGALYAGILRFRDQLGLSRVDLPVSATAPDQAGLWVGAAAVTQVQHYLKAYAKDGAGKVVQNASGAYVASGTNTSLGAVAKPFPLRLILHHDGTATRLLQRVFVGVRSNTPILATTARVLDASALGSVRRLSSAHLPWSAESPGWTMAGTFQTGGSLEATVSLSHEDQASNPFLHTYHPDHDNLDALFATPQAQGVESYRIQRGIRLALTAPGDDFGSLTSVHRTRTGTYDETITVAGKGTESRRYEVRGSFVLNRISEIPTLTLP